MFGALLHEGLAKLIEVDFHGLWRFHKWLFCVYPDGGVPSTPPRKHYMPGTQVDWRIVCIDRG
jgi:hypothetical protein